MTTSVSGPFVSLHNHTELGSPLDGMNRVDEIFKRAKEVDHPALAITDHGTLTAHYDCWEESKKTGIKLIPGIEAYFSDDLETKKTNHMVLLAQNEIGYRNILRLNYESYKNQVSGYMGKTTPRITWEHIEKYNQGIVCLTACSNGLIAKTLITDENEEQALCYIDRLNQIFNSRFYLEIQPHALYAMGKTGRVVDQQKLNQAMIRISHDKGIPYVITCDAHYKDKDHAKYHDFMLAIKEKKPVDDPERFRYGVQDMYLKTHEEIADFFGSEIASVGMKNSLLIADQCEVPSYLEPKGPMLPRFPVQDEKDFSIFMDWKKTNPQELEDDKAYLRYKCLTSFQEKFKNFPSEEKKEIWGRVKKELSVLESRDFSSYMLIVADYINWAKSKGMPVGPGRGCFIPGSLVVLADGSSKRIEEVSIGDVVISHDQTKNVVSNCLTYSVDEELIELEFEDGRIIKCTKDHEIFTENRGWVAARDLNEDDDISALLSALKLKSKKFFHYKGNVHDLTVENTHSYNIDGIAVHNSAAGSLVAYLIGVTTVNPLEYGLIFERFHNKEKKSFPDIDSDFSDPAAVKDYLKEKYGEDRVASISNWSTLSPKVIVKDIARSLQIGGSKSTAFQISNHITSIMPDTDTLEEAMEQSEQFAKYMHQYPEIYENAIKLQGLTRNWSVHAAGVVISTRPLYEIIPLRIDHKTGLTITQWEKERCEKNGLIKMDLLGVKTLTVMDECLKLIEKNYNEKISIDEIPLDDPETYQMISRGETAGVFQLESSLTPLCRKIKPKNLEMISAINALGRPSCDPETRERYIKRALNLEKVEVEHPNLKRALEKTNGILLYEESAMSIAQDCAGWDLNEADALRKISKLKGKDPELVKRTEMKFIADCMKHSKVSYTDALHIWDKYVSVLGGYSFNKSHSVAYSFISVYTAWLRKHYPTEFMCALLNSEDPNSDKIQEYITECKNMKIQILPPAVSKSGANYVVEEAGLIFTGLSAIKGVGDTAISNILENKPYSSFVSFLVKTDARVVNKKVFESFAKAGAFDCFGVTRKDIHDNHSKYRTKISTKLKKLKDEYAKHNDPETFEPALYVEELEKLNIEFSEEEWERKDILLYEKEILGRTISGGLHEIYGNFFRVDNPIVMKLNELDKRKTGSKVKIEVIINNKLKEFTIKNGPRVGSKFAKYLVEDAHGNTSELTVWSDDYEKYRDYLKDGTPIKAICQVNEYMGQKGLSLSSLERRM